MTEKTSQCPLWFFLTHPAPLGLDVLVQTWPRLSLHTFSPIALLPGVLERVRQDRVLLVLVDPFWQGQVWFSDLISLLDSSPCDIPNRSDLLSQAEGMILHPRPELWKLRVCPLRGAQIIPSSLSAGVVETILQSRAPSMRKLYALKRRLDLARPS